MSAFDRLKLHSHATDAMRTLAGVEDILAQSTLDPLLRHLIKLRASQINGCAFCVTMHLAEAREDAESEERLDHLVVWREVALFSAAERAALAWTEALSRLDAPADLGRLHEALSRHFGEAEIAALTTAIGMINLWNRLMVASHRDQPRLAA